MDSTTMVLALALGNLALCAALFFFEHVDGRPAALSAWGWGRQYQAAGWLLLAIGAAGVMPEGLAFPAAYGLVFVGVAWECGAQWERAGRARWRRVLTPLLGLAIAAFVLCNLIDPFGLRAIAASLILGGFYLGAAVALAQGWREASMLRRFMALSTGVLALVVGARGALVLIAPAGWGWMSNDLLRQLHSGALYLLAVLGAFGWLLLGRERLQGELARLEIVDPLTDVPNRRGFFQALAPWMALARRPGQPTSLVLGGFYLGAAVALAIGWTEASMLRRFLALATGILALVVGARGALVLAAPAGWGWMSSDLLRQLHTGALYLLAVLGAFGWLLLGRERLQGELARMEIVDPLTDVPNRRGFFQTLAPWMALARRPGQPTALVLFDLDQFKRINDGYGHPAGDVVLAALAAACKRQLRDSDVLGRLVGVEFAILLPRTGEQDALMVAERMRAAIEAQRVKTERALISLTASFGVTTIRPEDSNVTLLARADEALRAAKAAGRNRVELAAPPVPAE